VLSLFLDNPVIGITVSSGLNVLAAAASDALVGVGVELVVAVH